jgi:hypothetical protein
MNTSRDGRIGLQQSLRRPSTCCRVGCSDMHRSAGQGDVVEEYHSGDVCR